MRKTAAFVTALLVTASFAGSTWTVSAEENVPAETAVSQEENKPGASEENSSGEKEESGENQEGENPEEEVKEPGEELLKFAEGLSENSESARELALKLMNREVSAADVLKEFFAKREYVFTEDDDRVLIKDICKYVLLDEGAAEDEYEKHRDELSFGMSSYWFLREYILSESFKKFCEENKIDCGDIELTENRDQDKDMTFFVQRLYKYILGRRSDISGLNKWIGWIKNDGRTGAFVANGFYTSTEYREKNTSDYEYAESLIRMFYGREPEDGEVQKLVDSTLALGHTRDALLRKFILSDEYAELCKKAGITVGDITVGGWKYNDDGFKCYYSPDTGMMVKGYAEVTGIPCWFDNDGTLRTDWSDLNDIVDTNTSVYSFTELENDITELQQQYPSLVKVYSIGVTADGRQIYDVVIGNPDSGISTVIAAGVSGSKSSDSQMIMAETEKVLKNYGTGTEDGKKYSEIFENCCVHIIPMLNPDGVSIAQFGLKGLRNESLRARVRSIYMMDRRDGCTDLNIEQYLKGWQANALGTDLQYDALQYSPENKAHPSFKGYAGLSGVFERETTALSDLLGVVSQNTIGAVSAEDFRSMYGKSEYPLAQLMKESAFSSADPENVPDENTPVYEEGDGTAENASAGEENAVTETPAEEVTENKENSAEETQSTGGYQAFTTHLYHTLLRRSPDSEGLAFWSEALRREVITPSEAIRLISESREFSKKNFSDEEFVKYVFEAACGRIPSDEEKNKYLGLISGGYARSYVTARITETSDFISQCSKYGISATDPSLNGWVTDSKGTYYYQNGMKVCNDLRNIDGFTYIFDKEGNLLTGTWQSGLSYYYAVNGFVMPRRGIDWGAEIKKGNVRGETGTVFKMDVPVDYQFLYTRVICTIGGKEKTVREAGCGAASASMVIRYLTGATQYTPEYLFEWAYNNNQYFGNGLAEQTITNFLKLAGLDSYWIQPSYDKVKRALEKGRPVIVLMHEGYFTSSGHYIVLTGITDDGYVTVNDPNNSSLGRMEFKLDAVLEQSKCFMICGISEADDREPEKVVMSEEQILKSEFVERLYTGILGRKYDENGRKNWIGRLETGSHSADSVVYGFINSTEYREKNTSDEEFVDMLYRVVMDCEPDAEGREYWLSCLKAGYLRAGVLKGFTETDEFAALCEKYKIARGTFNAGGWSKNSEGQVVYCDSSTGKPLTGYNVVNNINCYFDDAGVLRTDWSDLKSYVDTSSAVYSYEDMISDINGLKEQYPSLVNINSIGTTADGRKIYDMVIGSSDAKKQMVIQAGCHAREYMGCMLLMNQAEYFLAHYWDGSWSDRSYKDLLDNYQIHIIPMLNPDGVTLSQKGLSGINSESLRNEITEIYKRDLADGVTSSGLEAYLRSWKCNARGVDINRNFGVPEWADQGEIQRPSCGKYAGPAPDSEAETKAIETLINSLSDCKSVISYHSSGSMIYWQYHQSGQFLESSRVTANTLRGMTGYYLISEVSSGGGCSNWVADVKKIFACTIEIGSGESPLPLSQYSGIWNSNKNVIPYMLSAY